LKCWPEALKSMFFELTIHFKRKFRMKLDWIFLSRSYLAGPKRYLKYVINYVQTCRRWSKPVVCGRPTD
jgi:hypothetical protein